MQKKNGQSLCPEISFLKQFSVFVKSWRSETCNMQKKKKKKPNKTNSRGSISKQAKTNVWCLFRKQSLLGWVIHHSAPHHALSSAAYSSMSFHFIFHPVSMIPSVPGNVQNDNCSSMFHTSSFKCRAGQGLERGMLLRAQQRGLWEVKSGMEKGRQCDMNR